MSKESLEPLRPGERVSARQWNLHVELLKAMHTGGSVFVDNTGVYHRPMPADKEEYRHFKLNEAFTTGGTVSARWWKWNPQTEAYEDTGDDFDVTDTFSWWTDATSGTKGIARKIRGASGAVWEIWDLNCDA